MPECKHPRLVLLQDSPGDTSNRYQCDVCKDILVVETKPYVIGVGFGKPPKE
jgi:hypothetical protein